MATSSLTMHTHVYIHTQSRTLTGPTTRQRIPPADRARMARRAQFDLLSERLCSEAIHAGAMAGAGRAVDIAIEDQGVFRTAQGAPFTRDAIVNWKRCVVAHPPPSLCTSPCILVLVIVHLNIGGKETCCVAGVIAVVASCVKWDERESTLGGGGCVGW